MSLTTKASKSDGTAERGRPRQFDEGTALAAAAQVFRENGYHATSIEDLCKATGVLRGSLYGAYGDKRGMLLAALDHYSELALLRLTESLNTQKPSRDALRGALLYYTTAAATVAGRGCLVTNTTMEMLPEDDEISERVKSTLRKIAALLTAEVVRGQAAGIFDSRLDERAVGNFLLCVIQGLRVLRKISDDEQELVEIVDMAMRVLA